MSLFFHLLWGLNYYRIPLNEKLNYNLEYNEDQLEQTLKSMIESTNKLHQSLTHTDSLAVLIPYSKIEIKEQLQANFSFKLADFKTQPYLKNSLWSTVLSYMGFAGYLNPLTLESQVNSKIPKLYYTKSHFPLEISQRAFDHLWRVCESYEMWCNETKQKKLITLKILD